MAASEAVIVRIGHGWNPPFSCPVVTSSQVDPVNPPLSVTVSRTGYVPGAAKGGEVSTPVPEVPSPKSQPQFEIVPSTSADCSASWLTWFGFDESIGPVRNMEE